jgi:monoamine oxidase
MGCTRREFLLASGAALAAFSTVRAQNGKNVLVLGAGLSGLSAAYELAQRGYGVTVLEGRDRVGGRIKTLREPFRDRQYVELGAELIGDGYKRLVNYIKKLEVPFQEVPERFETAGSVSTLQWGTGTTAVLKGKLFPVGSVLRPHPYRLKEEEAKGLPPVLLSMHVRAMAQEVARDPEKLDEYDRMSLAAALRKRGVSEKAIRLMNVSLNYNSIETVSAGGVIYDGRRRATAGVRPLRLIGGNDRLIKAFQEYCVESGVKFVLDARVRKIARTENGVSVSFAGKAGRVETLSADSAVCTIPFSVLRGIEFTPALPEAKAKAIRELPYTRITKVYFQAKRFEWDRRSIGTSVWTDTPVERIFEMAGTRGDERGIFTTWTDGDSALAADRLSDAARQSWARANLLKALPFMRGSIERSATKSWVNDEFSKGAFAHLLVGQLTGIKKDVATAVGNIHFAGEHTAENSPGMEGALESAERVVREIAGG